MNQYRCETCKYRWNLPKGNSCPFQKEEVYYKLKEEVSIPSGTDLFTSIVGCASHSDFQSEPLNLTSSDLLLIAHDEWKRREERKHIHEHISWVNGWISGFLTPRKFVQEKVAELRQAGEP